MWRISENGFGILANCWSVFRRPFSLEPEKVKKQKKLGKSSTNIFSTKEVSHGSGVVHGSMSEGK